MALQINRPLNDRFLNTRIANINTASTDGFVVSPYNGKIVAIYGVAEATQTTTNTVLGFKVNGTAGTGTGTRLQSGSAIGDVVTILPSALNGVKEGDYIQVTTNNAGTGAVGMTFTVVIRQ